MKRILGIIALAATFTVAAQAQETALTDAREFKKVGASVGQFLKIGVGGRSTAMGTAYAGFSGDLSTLHYNVAGMNTIEGIAAEFGYTSWFGGFTHNFMALSVPVGEDYRAAIDIVSFSSGQINVRTLADPDGTGAVYSLSDVAIGLSFGGDVTENFSFAGKFKYIDQGFSSLSASGIAFDFGTMYNTGIKGIMLGFAVANLGSDLTYEGQDLVIAVDSEEGLDNEEVDATLVSNAFSLPLSFRAGISVDLLNMDKADNLGNTTLEHQLNLGADFIYLSDSPEQAALGVEYAWNEIISLRGGYLLGHDQMDVSGGAGINYDGGSFAGAIDYSVTNTVDLGLIHRVTVGLDLN